MNFTLKMKIQLGTHRTKLVKMMNIQQLLNDSLFNLSKNIIIILQ